MSKRVAGTIAGIHLSCLLTIALGTGSISLAQASPDGASATPAGPIPAVPRNPGLAGEADWLPGSPAAADSAAADSLGPGAAGVHAGAAGAAPGDSARTASPPGRTTTARPIVPGYADGPTDSSHSNSGARPSAEVPGTLSVADHSLRLPPNTATGFSIGYPSYPSLFIVTPADGPLAFRSGLIAFPTIGLLWTPGLEYRFGQEPGTLSQNSVYAFGNAFLGRTYLDGDEHEYTGAEAGIGYRWLIDDRRGVRWIAAVEGGGYWHGDPLKPRRPCLRFLWTLVE